MNINEIKAEIGQQNNTTIGTLMFVRQMKQKAPDAPETEPDEPTEWLSHWDNDKRIRVTLHQDVLKTIQNGGGAAFGGLAMKKEVVPAKGDRAAYTRYVLITPNHVEAAF